MIISIDAKIIWPNSTLIYDKNTEQTRKRSKSPEYSKGHISKPTVSITFPAVKITESFPFKITNKSRMPTLQFLFNMLLEY